MLSKPAISCSLTRSITAWRRGSLRTYAGEKIPAYLSAKKMSLHQNSFSEVLALADIRGHLPCHIALVGLQPALLDDYGGSLSEIARSQLPAAETGRPGATGRLGDRAAGK
ncbi:hydrogenase-1 operon protein HyaD [Salmonella enterica subsp. enterica]|uniref:Hydrogenase-1 operon protein HyaD n=1 Tax=Salmonella enterica I TaxID=59201 RepID=A0A447U236_SALET|nr:hydrogenase-1 operon protein HyaD [Salmonella enterica subsp. enterica]